MSPYIRLSESALDRRGLEPFAASTVLPTGIFMIDDAAPIICGGADGGRRVLLARWGMPSPGRDLRAKAIHRAYREKLQLTDEEFERLAADEPDTGAPFVDASAFIWRSYLEPRGRCVVPFSAVGALRMDTSTALADEYVFPPSSTLGFLGGVYQTGWRGVRRPELGRETVDLFGLVSVERIVQSELHKRAFTPIVLANDAEVETWLNAPWSRARALRRRPSSAALV